MTVQSRTSLVLLASLSLTTLAAAQVEYYSARLTGEQEVPPVTTNATGWGVVRLDATSGAVSVYMQSFGMTGTAAHIHLAPRGSNGGVLVGLTGGPLRWTGNGTLTPAQVSALRTGGCYLNAHSALSPSGEIRGQIVEASSARFLATMDGSQEVPPNRSTETGEAVAFLHEPDNVVMYVVRTTMGSRATAAHFHAATTGNNGSVVFPLNGAGDYCGVSRRLSAAEVTALKSGGMYVNVHSATFPGGEIRGQVLAPSGDELFSGTLSGSNEVPPNASNAGGAACVELTTRGTLRYTVTTAGVVATAAHIHRAPTGTNGPVVFPLAGGPSVFTGETTVLSAADLTDLRSGNFYVNVHSSTFPGGEIRTQLAGAARPTTFGGACPTSLRELPEIHGNGLPCRGTSFDVEIAGGLPSSAAALMWGLSRDFALNARLPLALDGLGMQDCVLLVDLTQLPVLATPTDARGCGGIAIQVPYLPSLRGVSVYFQWLVLDRAANAFGLVTSNGLMATIE
ncbi:MAG: CHRD domain-containing protein [Planctomycetes bacterium]|nr:CHRD domain-containing protein [Planctomycetota bacterium]